MLKLRRYNIWQMYIRIAKNVEILMLPPTTGISVCLTYVYTVVQSLEIIASNKGAEN